MAGGLDLGDLYSKLRVDYKDVVEAESKARKFADTSIASFAAVERSASRIKSVGSVLTGVGVAMLGFGVASAKMANDFDKNIAEINSLLPETSRDFQGLKNDIRGVSMELGVDLNKSARAAYQALSAGVPKDNLVSFLSVATKSAIAGVTDTEVAVDGLSTVMNAWKKSAGSAEDVADVMFTAVKNGKTTFAELSASIFQVAGIAPELGVSFKEIAAATANMTAQGVPTSVTMTQLRASMAALAKPNGEMVKLLKAAGITSVDTATKTLGLVGTLSKLRTAAEKSGLSIDEAMGGSEAMGVVWKNTGANAESFGKQMDNMTDSAKSAMSAFEEVDKVRGFDKLMNNLKSIATMIGDSLIPILLPAAEKFATFLQTATSANPELVGIGVAIAGVIAALGPLLLGVGSLLSAFTPLVASAGGIGAAFASIAAMAGPVGLAVLGIAAAGYTLYQNWEQVSAFMSKIIEGIIAWFNKWKTDNSALVENLSQSWGSLVTAAQALWEAIVNFTSEGVANTIAMLDSLLEPLGGIEGALQIYGAAWGAVFTFVVGHLKILLDFFSTTFTAIADYLNGNASLWETLKAIASAAITGIVEAVKNLWAAIKPGIQAIWDGISAIDWKQLGINMMKGLAAGIASAAGAVKDAALKGVTDAYEGAKDFLGIKSPSRLFMDIGKYTMAGLAIGIAEASPQAERAAELSAGRVLMAYENGIQAHKEQTTASLMEAMGMRGADSFGMGMGGGFGMGSMGTGMGMGSEFEDVGGGSVAGMPDLAGITAYYDERLALLTEKGMAETQLFQAIEAQKQDIVSQAQQVTLSTYANAFDGVLNATAAFAGKQSGIYRAMFAASKAFAIAESLVAIQQNIANAMRVGFPQNIPFIAGAIAQGGGILSSLKSIAAPSSAGAFYNGGVIPGGKTGIAGEKGVELVGPAGVMSTQKTKELLSGGSGGAANVNITVEIIDNSGSGNSFSVEQSDDNKIRIVVDRVKKEISADIARGSGAITSTLENRYGLKRK